MEAVAGRVPWVRLLYLYPSDLTERLVDAILATGVPVLRPLAAARVAARCCAACAGGATASGSSTASTAIRAAAPDAAFRSNFIVGYPGETEADHDQLLAFVDAAQLDWCGFFAYSQEDGTYAADLDGAVAAAARGRAAGRAPRAAGRHHRAPGATTWSATVVDVLVDAPGRGPQPPRGAGDRRHHHRPRRTSRSGALAPVRITGAEGPDSCAEPLVLARAMTAQFGPSALATPANLVTIGRLVAHRAAARR